MENRKLYEANISAFEKRWPDYAHFLKNPDRSSGISVEVSEEEDSLIPFVHKDGREYQLASAYSDDRVLDRWIEFVNLQLFESVIYLFGIGTGMYVRRLLTEFGKNDKNSVGILVYEPNFDILNELIKYYDYCDIFSDEKVDLIFGIQNDDKFYQWTKRHISYKNIHSAGSAYYLNYPRIFTEDRKKYDKEIEELLGEYYGNMGFKKSFSDSLYNNVLDNIRRMADTFSLDSLMDSLPEDVPVFVVSSGPSLSKNIKELKRAKGRGIIIAVDSSLGVFDKFEIIPDIYVSIDPEKQKENFDYEWVSNVPVLLEMTSPKYVVKDGQVYYMICTYDNYIGKFLKNKSKNTPYHVLLNGGGCQASFAFSLGVNMGAKTIIFVGQDLAYTGDKAHAAEVAIEEDEMLNTVETIDIDGNPIKTNRQLVGYRRWFERAISHCENLEAIDATEGGARIEGTTQMTLKEAIDKYCVRDWDVEKSFSGCERLLINEERREYYDYLKLIPDKMEEILFSSRKLIDDYNKLETLVRRGRVTTGKLKKLLSATKKLSDTIEENDAYSYITMINSTSEVNVEETVNNVDPDLTKDLINMCTLGREHTENIIKAAEKVKKDFSELKLDEF